MTNENINQTEITKVRKGIINCVKKNKKSDIEKKINAYKGFIRDIDSKMSREKDILEYRKAEIKRWEQSHLEGNSILQKDKDTYKVVITMLESVLNSDVWENRIKQKQMIREQEQAFVNLQTDTLTKLEIIEEPEENKEEIPPIKESNENQDMEKKQLDYSKITNITIESRYYKDKGKKCFTKKGKLTADYKKWLDKLYE